MQYMPLVVYVSGLFFTGLGIAVGLTLWIVGKLTEQDAKRTEQKEVILLEIREREKTITAEVREYYNTATRSMKEQHVALSTKIDGFHNEMTLLSNRLVAVETLVESRKFPYPS